MKYTIALVDVDDTLLDFGKSERAALQTALTAFGVPFDNSVAALYHNINDALWKRLEQGELTRAQLWEMRFKELFHALKRPLPDGVNDRYMASLAEQAFPMEGAQQMLEQASKRVQLYIVSNGVGAVQRRRLKTTGLDVYFKDAFLSQELGVQKPSAAFFDKVFDAIGPIDRSRVILLGDSLTSDMKGARNAGVAACWFCPDESRPDVPGVYDIRISRLGQFIDVLEGRL